MRIELTTTVGAFSREVIVIRVVAAEVAVVRRAATVVDERQLVESYLGLSFV